MAGEVGDAYVGGRCRIDSVAPLASWLVGDSDGRGDIFLADKAWFYVTLLTVGYLVSRGLAKAGSGAHHDA